jgi:hypothetical protein
LAGPLLVQPGPEPDEFWLLTADSMRRWSAKRRLPIGDAVTWPGRHLRLDRGHAIVRGSQPWTPQFARMRDGTFRALVPPPSPPPEGELEQYRWLGEPETPLAFHAASDTAAPMLLTSVIGHGTFTPDAATLRRLGDDGSTTHHQRFDRYAHWLAMSPNGARVYVGLSSGSVFAFDSEQLKPLAEVSFETPLVAAAAFGGDHLLASDGRELMCLDATTLALVAAVPMPEGLRGADRIVSSADGRHVAVGHGSDVRILAVE